MNHPNRGISYALLFSFILVILGLTVAFAGTIEYRYVAGDNEGVWPVNASANSERYFRCEVGWNPTNENFTTLSLSCSAGTYYLRRNSVDATVQEGVTIAYITSSSTSNVRVYTIGPFAGYDIWWNPHVGTVNALPWDATWRPSSPNALDTPSPAEAPSNDRFRFAATFVSGTPPTAATVYTPYAYLNTVHDNKDYLQWFSGDAAGVDPLTVEPAQISPDDGTGSSRFRFRVRYAAYGIGANLPPRTERHQPTPDTQSGLSWADYNYDTGMFQQRADWGRDNWMYAQWDDSFSEDRIGWSHNWGGQEPAVILIIDGDLTRPRFMYQEDPTDTDYDGGITYYYDILPTDYKRYIDNVLLFPYDPGGGDELDRFLGGMRGRAMSNNYVALSAGGHTYEFIATDDFSPCNGNNAWCQVGRPGNGLCNDYIRIRPFRHDWQGGEITSFEVNNVTRTVHNSSIPSANTRYVDSDGAAGGSGYPYNSQDTTRYPKVDPVLSAHPYFPSGTIQLGSDFTPDPLDFSGIRTASPFPAEVGGGPNPALRYTNDDTILPNYVNIFPATSLTPFRGGKWTRQTTYTFRINYWQSQSVAPTFVRVFIRRVAPSDTTPGFWNRGATEGWQAYTMEQMNAADRNYTDGCVFQFQATPEQLPGGGGSGDYNYYFAASDGSGTCIFPNRPAVYAQPSGGNIFDPGHFYFSTTLGQYGVPTSNEGEDYYWFRVNRPPTLSGQSVSPAAGRAGENYRFSVNYTEVDGGLLDPLANGDRPFHAKIFIDLFGSPLGQASVVQIDSATSVTYQTATGQLYANNELAGLQFTLQSGTAAGTTLTVAGNTGNVITLTTNVPVGVAAGDRFVLETWFQGTMVQSDSTDTDYSDGAEFVFNTATNVELGTGTHRYYFEFTDDWGSWLFPNDANVKVEGETIRYPLSDYFEGPQVRENTPPNLTDFRFSPRSTTGGADGTTATGFTFYVTYVDQENDPPALIRLGVDIDGDDATGQNPDMVLDMVPNPATDTVYTDGATYETSAVKLPEGQHKFYAQASDGRARFPETAPGDPLIFSGPLNDTNGNGRLDPGETYQTSVTGPNVAPNTPPVLSFPDDDNDPNNYPGLDPDTGSSGTLFTYRVRYTDADRFAGVRGNPPRYVRVYIDDVPYDMTAVDPTDDNYTDGAMFEYSISGLIEGKPHTYFFIASDDLDMARLPAIGSVPYDRYDGPVVDEPPRPPLNLVVEDTQNDNGGSLDIEFSASLDDGGGARDVTEYRVYRSETQGQYGTEPILTIPATGAAAYSAQDKDPDSTPPPVTGVAYYYVVKAFDGAAESAASNEEGPRSAIDNIPPQPPSGVVVTNPALGGTLDVFWNLSPDDNVAGDVTEYHIYRSTNNTTFVPPMAGTVAAGESTFRDTNVADGVPYYYVVRAYDGSNESIDSNVGGPTTSTDGDAPVISDLLPADGATGVSRNTNISCVITDNGSGVDRSSVQMAVNVLGAPVAGNLALGGTATRTTVTFTPAQAFEYLRNVRVDVAAADMQGNARAKSWSFIIQSEPTSIISGRVADMSDVGMPGVTVIAGELQGVTGADGVYTIQGVADGTHEVRAQRDNFYFTPLQIAVSVPPDAVGINFTGQPAFDISGTVTHKTTEAGMAGVTITAAEKTAFTDANGNYTVVDLPAGTYRVVSLLDGFDFDPVFRDVTIPTTAPDPGRPNAINVNFEATVESHSLSGTIRTSTGARMNEVTVRARNLTSGYTQEVRSVASGLYVFQGLPQGTYDVTPSIVGYQFKPLKQTIELLTQKADVDFIGVPLYTVALPSGLSFVAVPITPENTDFRAAFGANTPVARWDGENEQWVTNLTPADPLLELAPGRGFWVRPALATTNYVAGTPISTGVGFDLAIGANWTMAGNPYPANLPWANLGIAAGGAVKDYGYIWDRSARDYRIVADVTGIGIIDTIPQGAGFWTHSTMARTVRVNPLTGTAAVKTPALVLSAGDYILPLQATTSGCADTCAAAGVIKAADTLPGAGRLINPPAAGAGVDLYFLGGDGAKLAYDIRSKAAGTETWDFEVLADIGDVPVSISLPDVSGVPLDKQITLIDTTTGRRIYVRTTQLYTYQAEDGQPRRFTLEIAPRSVGSLNISATSAAMSRGGQVAVTYALSQPAGVSISVMNIGGREVKQLTAGKAAASGVNTEIWDLTNSHGAGVPAGRYLLSIIATTDTGQQARAIVPVQVNR